MAIKTISKLDPYANDIDEGQVGGSIHLYKTNNDHDQIPATMDPQGQITQIPIEYLETQNYNLLFEVSKPAVGTGSAGLTDSEFQSYKLTYKDLVNNVILDTKTYLNARNNLGDFDLSTLVYGNYYFRGDKSFNGDVNVYSDLSVKGDAKIDQKFDVTGRVNFGSTLYVASNLTCNGDICGKGALSVIGALYTATLSSDSSGTIIKPGTNGFIVQNVLTATTTQVTITPPVKINNNLTANDGSFDSVNATTVTATTINGTTGSFSGSLTANSGTFSTLTCNGNCELTANHAKWSDLAEYYKADSAYEPGTLVKFGGTNEVTIAEDEANGIVTSKPAFLMNCGMKDDPLGCAVALAGRVPVKVVGKVKKFDKIILAGYDGYKGIAQAVDPKDGTFKNSRTLGRALESNDSEEVKLVECVVKFEL